MSGPLAQRLTRALLVVALMVGLLWVAFLGVNATLWQDRGYEKDWGERKPSQTPRPGFSPN